jgi:hypothetical protein
MFHNLCATQQRHHWTKWLGVPCLGIISRLQHLLSGKESLLDGQVLRRMADVQGSCRSVLLEAQYQKERKGLEFVFRYLYRDFGFSYPSAVELCLQHRTINPKQSSTPDPCKPLAKSIHVSSSSACCPATDFAEGSEKVPSGR